MTGELSKFHIGFADGELVLVLKTTSPGGKQLSANLGLAREGLFYKEFALQPYLPKIYYSEGDLATGVKNIFMEPLFDCV